MDEAHATVESRISNPEPPKSNSSNLQPSRIGGMLPVSRHGSARFRLEESRMRCTAPGDSSLTCDAML
eukprot:114261-Rhodomonas_salina.1